MKLPFVTRAHHEEVVALLQSRIAEIEQERRVYLDRLATAGLGGPLFVVPAPVEQQPLAEAEPPQEVDDAEFLRALRTRPSDMAAAITRRFRRRIVRDAAKEARGAHIRHEVEDELNAAEAAGRRQASR
jgi:hypothetical protein